jgi:hypothetical protein
VPGKTVSEIKIVSFHENSNKNQQKSGFPLEKTDKVPENPIEIQINHEKTLQSIENSLETHDFSLKSFNLYSDPDLFPKLFSPFTETSRTLSLLFTQSLNQQNMPISIQNQLFSPYKILTKVLKKALKLTNSLIIEFQCSNEKPSKVVEKTDFSPKNAFSNKDIDISAGYRTDQNKAANSHFSIDFEDFMFSEKEATSPEKVSFHINNINNSKRRNNGKSHQIMIKYNEMAEILLRKRLPELIKQRPRFNISISSIYKLISNIYQEALRLFRKKEDYFCELPAFLCDFFLKKFGLRKVAETKILHFIYSLIIGPFENNRKIRLFLRFLGLDEINPPFAREFEFFLGFLLRIDENIAGSSMVFVNIERFVTNWRQVIEVCEEIFEEKAGKSQIIAFVKEVARKIGVFNQEDAIIGDEFDRLIEMFIEFYKEINADLFKIVFNVFGRREKNINKEELKVLLRNFSEKSNFEIKNAMKNEKIWDFMNFQSFFIEKMGITLEKLQEMVSCEDFEEIKANFKEIRKELNERFGNRLHYRKLLKIVEICLDMNSRIAMRTMFVGYKMLINEYRQEKIQEMLIPEEFDHIRDAIWRFEE